MTKEVKQEQDEPAAYVNDQYSRDGYNDEISKLLPVGTYLYTTPQTKEWFGLTDDEKEHIEISGGKADLTLAEKIEAILKERNT